LKRSQVCFLASLAPVVVALVAPALSRPAVAQPEGVQPAAAEENLWSRPELTGTWGGFRESWAAHGLTVGCDATYTFQGIAGGGFDGPVFDAVSDEDDIGHTVSGDLKLQVDTGQAGWWKGGYFNARLEGRAGRSVLQRAGSVSAVNNDAIFPDVVERFDEETGALTELLFTQYLLETVAVFGGLMNTAEGDENELAGSALSNAHFFNTAMLYSLVEDATVPNVSLGGGVLFEPDENVSGSVSAFGTKEAAGENPFDDWEGTTVSTEWTLGYTLRRRPGAQTFGFLYGFEASRTNIAADPRRVLGGILRGQGVPATEDDTWAFYYNGHQYVRGDAGGGWGVFARFGASDGNPNPVEWHVAGGLGGKGLLPWRRGDTWGIGGFYLGMSDEDLLEGLSVSDEVGGDVFYNIALTPWLHLVLDAQVIDSALPRTGTTWVLGTRTQLIL
jgi:porin